MVNKIIGVLFVFILLGCQTTEVIRYVDTPKALSHPILPTPPKNPSLSIRVITDETIETDKAYVGFEYNDWLEFSKWMHEYKTYNSDLLHVIELYKEQDETQEKDEKN